MRKLTLLLMACTLSLMVSARVAYLVPGNSNDKSQIPAQWENHTFEHTAYDWFETNYVKAYGANEGVGDFINFTNIPTNTDEYAAIWIYIDREWVHGDPDKLLFTETEFDNLFTNDVVNALKTYVQNGGNLFLGKQAARLAYRMGRIGYAPAYACDGYSQDDRFWGIKAKLGSNLAAENQRDRSSHPIYAGLATARMDNVDGCFPLLNAMGDAHSTNSNINWVEYWTPNGEGGWHKNPDNNADPALIDGWETYWNAHALGTFTHIGDYCHIMAVEFMPKDAFTGKILAMGIASYQWNSESTGDAANNVKKLTKNALRYLNTPSRKDLRIDNAFKSCGRVDCGSSDAHFNEFMILHPVVEGLNAQPYTTSFDGIEEADRAVVEQWNDNGTMRLAFAKAGQVKLQIHLNEARTDHFWPAGDYNYEQTIDFAFSADPVSVISDLSDNGIDKTEKNHFMVLHGNMQGLNATYTTSFEDIEEADRATVEIQNLDGFNRLVFTTPGSVKLNINLNAPEYTTKWAKGDHSATKTVTYNPFAWTHEPDHARIGEQKDAAQATCAVEETTVKYESSNPTVATINEATGKITYLAVGTSDITAYAEIEGIKSVSKPFTINVSDNVTKYTRATAAGKYGTICLERTPLSVEGATFFAPVEIVSDGSQIIGINLEEVPVSETEAGVGYYFLADAAEVVVSMDLNETELTAPVSEIAKTHGMLGTFVGGVTVPNDQNEMILSNNQLWYGQNNTVGEHRAWLKFSELQEWINKYGTTTSVPGRRRVTMGVNQSNTTTGLENANVNDKVNKMLINGQLYILRAGAYYTVDGQLVK